MTNALLLKRRGMTAKESVLPDGQLEWIETDGVAYIDTGYTPNNYSSAQIRCFLPTSTSSNHIAEVMNGTNDRLGYLLCLPSGNISFMFGSLVPTGWTFDNTKINTFKTKFVSTTLRTLSVTPDGGTETINTNTALRTAPNLGSYHLVLFGLNNKGTVTPSFSGTKIYNAIFCSDSNLTTLVRNYVPWRLNGEVGLMDTLTNTFYGNAAGSGAFTGGPNVI